MGLFDFFRGKAGTSSTTSSLSLLYEDDGIRIDFETPLPSPTVEALLEMAERGSITEDFLVAYLAQLVVEERCELACGGIILPWELAYELHSSPEHVGIVQCLSLPPIAQLKPILASQDTLADSSFEVLLDGWAQDDSEVRVDSIIGAVAAIEGAHWLLPLRAWELSDGIRKFKSRPAQERTQHQNELGWGRLRASADAAGALYRSPYLETTFVLTPETLRLLLNRTETSFGRVLMVEPTFVGAPAGWLKAFDGFNSVQPHYDFVPNSGGHVRVVISDPVRQVLSTIKRHMPGRQVAGAQAERFIHNPWAFLGDAAKEVLLEDDFIDDRADAGPVAAYFSLAPRTRDSRIDHVDLVVTEHFHGGAARTDVSQFAGPDELLKFTGALEAALSQERAQFPWREYDLTLDGESTTILEYARQIVHLWRFQPDELISFEDIYELEGYSGRIEGIGVAKPIYVPVFQKPTAEEGKPGWVPDDLRPMVKITLAGHEGQVVIPLTREWVEEFEKQVTAAEASSIKEIRNSSLPTAVETGQARSLVDAFRSMIDLPGKAKPDGPGQAKKPPKKNETLLVKLNFHGVDYAEERRLSLALPSGAMERLPKCLRASVDLRKHQRDGIAWFQHLVSRAPMDCRGALLADDMGLGKTLQLLTVLGTYYEENPESAPSIILAPKSLVWNWAAETKKFFTESYPKVLILYDDELKKRKQPHALIDQQLHDKGVTELLRPGWAGDAKVIITTYETLTNYEFSFARQPFAFAICDEAQKIKTPGTQVSLAARALKADFRIACTGTPVENSLADLWCLFDFVQPGLLGALEEFGRTYRRPIECETDEQKDALNRLQQAIAPQTLRRTKQDILDELTTKYFVVRKLGEEQEARKTVLSENDRLEVAMSNHQSILYLGGLKKLRDAASVQDSRKRARLSFGALHLMRAVCAEPYCLPGMKFLPDKAGNQTHFQNSPKLAWLLSEFRRIRDEGNGDKVIVFTEVREVQAALFHFIKAEFGLKPFIINGDSQNRQLYIDRFSEAKGFNVIILSTLAAGAGLNVTAANHVFHFTRAWNPAKENQATDRAYRIGQKKDVFVYCPVVVTPEFPTFELRLAQLLWRKAGLADATLGGSSMVSMLNGTGRDASIAELAGDGTGAEVEKRFLTMDDVDRMDGFRFEVFCKLLWTNAGFVAQLTRKKGGDGGIDIVALKGKEGQLLQCKSSINPEVGWDAVKEVTAGAARYQAQFRGTTFRRVAVTNQAFTKGARIQADHNKVLLVERTQLEEMLSRHPVLNSNFEVEVDESVPYLDAA